MNIFDKIERTISQRHQQAFDNLGKSIEAMATSFDNFDFETLSSRISKKMMVHLDAIGNYFMEADNQDEILDKLGKKIEEKQELAFDPVLEYFNKPSYEIDQNLFGKVVKFQEDKSHQKGHIELVGKTSMRSRSSSEGSCNSRRKPRVPSRQGSIKSKRSLVKSIGRNRSSSRGSSVRNQRPKKLSPKNSQRSSSRRRSSSQGSVSSMKKPKKNNSKKSQRSIRRASPRNSEEEFKASVKSESKSQNSAEIKKEIPRQEIMQTEPISFCQHKEDNNALPQQDRPESSEVQTQIASNIDAKQQQIEEEQPVAKSNVEIIEQRAERLETRFNKTEKLKAQTTKLYPLTQKAQEKPQEEAEDNNQVNHQTIKIEVNPLSEANTDKKEEASLTDNAQTVKRPSSPQKQQGSVERHPKRQKTPPRMPYNIDVQYPRSIEKSKNRTPDKL